MKLPLWGLDLPWKIIFTIEKKYVTNWIVIIINIQIWVYFCHEQNWNLSTLIFSLISLSSWLKKISGFIFFEKWRRKSSVLRQWLFLSQNLGYSFRRLETLTVSTPKTKTLIEALGWIFRILFPMATLMGCVKWMKWEIVSSIFKKSHFRSVWRTQKTVKIITLI